MKKICLWIIGLMCAAAIISAEPSAELVTAAKKEGTLTVYSTTSRVSSAAKSFEAKYGIKVQTANLKDGELVEKVSTEVGNGVAGADMVICQDGARVYGELINPGYLVNYVPEDMKKLMPEGDQNPLIFQFINKVFIFNNEKNETEPAKNVWAFTDPEWKGRIQFKDPNTEGVNANFLTMLVTDEWAGKLAAAYKEHYGKDYAGEYENAGYAWIAGFFANAVMGNSDTTISENVGTKGQEKEIAGLFVLSKSRYEATKNLALKPMTEVKPFSGFYYPLFTMLTKNAKNPNAAKLFIDYLMTAEGFKPWSSDVGAYSGNPEIPANKGDFDFKFWRERLVPEDPARTYEKRAEVEEFVNNIL
ncbi:MAG: ABC transporter substrate-binding protein [Fusobacteriaceae bacterium]|nr:ABC transporter substrate-binding protein [Fusobacteriaceae bacterium]